VRLVRGRLPAGRRRDRRQAEGRPVRPRHAVVQDQEPGVHPGERPAGAFRATRTIESLPVLTASSTLPYRLPTSTKAHPATAGAAKPGVLASSACLHWRSKEPKTAELPSVPSCLATSRLGGPMRYLPLWPAAVLAGILALSCDDQPRVTAPTDSPGPSFSVERSTEVFGSLGLH
jgi:hypothetical protein